MNLLNAWGVAEEIIEIEAKQFNNNFLKLFIKTVSQKNVIKHRLDERCEEKVIHSTYGRNCCADCSLSYYC